jgi:FkbM family methyltransferase|tara:strand:+ start:592 stop:1290 length:699 start_codon:yes stop_codon:yes gene_type:complete
MNQEIKGNIKGHPKRSSNGQDLYVYYILGDSGYFVDIGAHDGKDGSNTYALEKAGWKGLCVEPSPVHQEALLEHRSCIIDNSLVYGEKTKKKYFIHNYAERYEEFKRGKEREEAQGKKVINWHAHLGGGGIVEHLDEGYEEKLEGEYVELETTTLLDILERHDAPKLIEFLDIDIEGAEYEVIKNFPFDKYEFKIICIEVRPHTRDPITEHLIANGYRYAQDIGQDAIFRKI